jgi:hypothetical protein
MEVVTMPSAIELREDYSAAELRRLAKRSKDVNQSRRLLSLDRRARRQGSGRSGQDWVHRFNADGPDGLLDHWTEGPKPRLTPAQLAELSEIVDTGPKPKRDGVVRWRRIDLKGIIAVRFGSTITNAM